MPCDGASARGWVVVSSPQDPCTVGTQPWPLCSAMILPGITPPHPWAGRMAPHCPHTPHGAGWVTQTWGDITRGFSAKPSASVTARDAHTWEKHQEQKRREKSGSRRGPAMAECMGGIPRLCPAMCPGPCVPRCPAPYPASRPLWCWVPGKPQELGAGGTRLRFKGVNKSIFKCEVVGEGEPPWAGLPCTGRA